MRPLGIIAGAVCIFLVGVYVGIRMDWSTWLKRPTNLSAEGGKSSSSPPINLEVERYGQANLVVHPGDIVQLSRPEIPSSNVGFRFKGNNSPCVEKTPGLPNCTISGDKPDGPYFFKCESQDGKPYNCPDPGIQQRTAPPVTEALKPIGLFLDIKEVLKHNLSIKNYSPNLQITFVQANSAQASQTTTPVQPNQQPGANPTVNAIPQYSAYVVCLNHTNAEVDPISPSGGANTQIPIQADSEFTWVGNSPFKVTLQGTGLCGASSIPSVASSDGSYQALCKVAKTVTPGLYHYQVALDSGCDNPSPDEIIQVNSSPKANKN